MKQTIKAVAPIFLLALIFFIQVSPANGQNDEQKLNALRNRFAPWRSIYINYPNFLKLFHLLKNPEKIAGLRQFHDQNSVGRLHAFVNRNLGKSINDSIAFIEIDLNRVEAGYKSASDLSGTITPINEWTRHDVIEVADFCDKLFNLVAAVQTLQNVITSGNLKIEEIFARIGELQDNPYASFMDVFPLVADFRGLLNKKSAEFAALKGENPELFNFIDEFKQNYDRQTTNFNQKLLELFKTNTIFKENKDNKEDKAQRDDKPRAERENKLESKVSPLKIEPLLPVRAASGTDYLSEYRQIDDFFVRSVTERQELIAEEFSQVWKKTKINKPSPK